MNLQVFYVLIAYILAVCSASSVVNQIDNIATPIAENIGKFWIFFWIENILVSWMIYDEFSMFTLSITGDESARFFVTNIGCSVSCAIEGYSGGQCQCTKT